MDEHRRDGLILGPALATLDDDAGHGLVQDGALAWRDGVIAYAGPRAGLPQALSGGAVEAGAGLPAYIDWVAAETREEP